MEQVQRVGAAAVKREQVQLGGKVQLGRSSCKVRAGAARSEQVTARWEQVQRSRCTYISSWSRCSEVRKGAAGEGAARSEQMQRDQSRCSEVEKGAARLEQVQRGQQKK